MTKITANISPWEKSSESVSTSPMAHVFVSVALDSRSQEGACYWLNLGLGLTLYPSGIMESKELAFQLLQQKQGPGMSPRHSAANSLNTERRTYGLHNFLLYWYIGRPFICLIFLFKQTLHFNLIYFKRKIYTIAENKSSMCQLYFVS